MCSAFEAFGSKMSCNRGSDLGLDIVGVYSVHSDKACDGQNIDDRAALTFVLRRPCFTPKNRPSRFTAMTPASLFQSGFFKSKMRRLYTSVVDDDIDPAGAVSRNTDGMLP